MTGYEIDVLFPGRALENGVVWPGGFSARTGGIDLQRR